VTGGGPDQPREGTFQSAGPFTTGVEVAGALAELGVQRIRLTPEGSEPAELETRETDLPGTIKSAIQGGAESVDLQALDTPIRVTIRNNEWSWAVGEQRAAQVFSALRADEPDREA